MINNESYLAFCSLYSNSYVGGDGRNNGEGQKVNVQQHMKRKVVCREGLKSNGREQGLGRINTDVRRVDNSRSLYCMYMQKGGEHVPE